MWGFLILMVMILLCLCIVVISNGVGFVNVFCDIVDLLVSCFNLNVCIMWFTIVFSHCQMFESCGQRWLRFHVVLLRIYLVGVMNIR